MLMMQVTTSATVVYHDPSSDVLLVGSMDFVLQAFDCKQRLGNIIYHKVEINRVHALIFCIETVFGLTSSKIQFWTLLVQNQEK